jgi:hypothetical protein
MLFQVHLPNHNILIGDGAVIPLPKKIPKIRLLCIVGGNDKIFVKNRKV